MHIRGLRPCARQRLVIPFLRVLMKKDMLKRVEQKWVYFQHNPPSRLGSKHSVFFLYEEIVIDDFK